MKTQLKLSAILFSSMFVVAHAAPLESGFLCCNMRTDGSWISDNNYAENGKRIVPLGTPIKFVSLGRYRVNVEIDGRRQSIGNDYSRELTLEEFAARYIVAKNPRDGFATLPPKIRLGMESMRVTKGMTKEQVIAAIGHPITSENPHLDVRQWRYWLSSFAPYTVNFDENWQVSGVTTHADTLLRVFIE